jgi:hypothetical protein
MSMNDDMTPIREIRERPRLTSVTGRSRDELAEERAAARADIAFTRGLAGNPRHARIGAVPAVQPSPSGLIGLAQAQEMVQSAVTGAVEGVHSFYRGLLGDERWRDAYTRYHSMGAVSVDANRGIIGGQPADHFDAPGTPLPDGASYRPHRPIEAEPFYMNAALDADTTQDAEGRSGYISSSGRGQEEPQQTGSAADGEFVESMEVEDNEPAMSQADAGTPEGASGEEGPPFPCNQCDFEAGSKRGLKAHKTTKHPASTADED